MVSLRHIDELGRIVIPSELRRELQFDAHASVEFFMDDNGNVVIQKHQDKCVICGGIDEAVTFRDKMLCGDCAQQMGKLNA